MAFPKHQGRPENGTHDEQGNDICRVPGEARARFLKARGEGKGSQEDENGAGNIKPGPGYFGTDVLPAKMVWTILIGKARGDAGEGDGHNSHTDRYASRGVVLSVSER